MRLRVCGLYSERKSAANTRHYCTASNTVHSGSNQCLFRFSASPRSIKNPSTHAMLEHALATTGCLSKVETWLRQDRVETEFGEGKKTKAARGEGKDVVPRMRNNKRDQCDDGKPKWEQSEGTRARSRLGQARTGGAKAAKAHGISGRG